MQCNDTLDIDTIRIYEIRNKETGERARALPIQRFKILYLHVKNILVSIWHYLFLYQIKVIFFNNYHTIKS